MSDLIRKANDTYHPPRIIAYGVRGLGKTTFGSTFESPILIPTEEGAESIDINTYPLVTTFQQMVDYITDLHGREGFKTLVIDSLDWLEAIIWNETCRQYEVDSIEKVLKGYGKGYKEALKHWRMILGGFDSLRKTKGMNIVMLAHSEVKRVEPPETETFDKYQMALQKDANALLQEWSDLLLFLNYRVVVSKSDQGFGKERIRGIGTGERMIFCSERPAFDAKKRWDLPEEIFVGKDLSWGAFHSALETATSGKYVAPKKEGEKKAS